MAIIRLLHHQLELQHTQAHHARQLEALQEIVFPQLSNDERMKAAQYMHHIELFPEGQMVITHNDEVIAMTTTMCTNFDFTQAQHSFSEISAGGWMDHHQPSGEWLYGLDIGVHPDYRGKGLAKALYQARDELVMALQLKGQLTVGLPNGYEAVAQIMSMQKYYSEWLAGERTDPTLTPQIKQGFVPLELINNYVTDSTCGNYGVLLQKLRTQ